MSNFNTAMIVCTLIHKTLSTYIRCNNDFGIPNTCTQYNETATVGQNITLGICIEKYNPVSWHKKTIKQLLCVNIQIRQTVIHITTYVIIAYPIILYYLLMFKQITMVCTTYRI